MSPGRDLDALVAEKVMGRALRGPRPADSLSFPLKAGTVLRDLPAEEPLPYSTSIEAAWEVVEKLKQSGIICEVIGQPWGFKVRFYRFNGEALDLIDGAVAQGDTAPHAISLAALKAMGAM